MGSLLALVAAVLLIVTPLPAQERLPRSTQDLATAVAHVAILTPNDFNTLQSQAQSGDREAQYLLALAYDDGRSVARDFAVSRNWMLKSAEQGYVPAQAWMGETYLRNLRKENGAIPDYGDAERWLRLAATQGNAEAQEWLGAGYERGWFGVTDYREALNWLRRSAAQGLPWAQFELGQMYEVGEGVPRSDSMAASWYRKAADHYTDAGGVWEAEVQLAYMYRGDRLPQDSVEAYMWLAVVGSSVVPPTAADVGTVARHMSKAQILEAQRRAEDWIKRHTPQSENPAQVN
jgi:TPR repeat protein